MAVSAANSIPNTRVSTYPKVGISLSSEAMSFDGRVYALEDIDGMHIWAMPGSTRRLPRGWNYFIAVLGFLLGNGVLHFLHDVSWIMGLAIFAVVYMLVWYLGRRWSPRVEVKHYVLTFATPQGMVGTAPIEDRGYLERVSTAVARARAASVLKRGSKT